MASLPCVYAHSAYVLTCCVCLGQHVQKAQEKKSLSIQLPLSI